MRQEKLLQPEEGCQLTCEGLDASVAKGFASLDRIQAGKEMLVRMVAMLTKLLLRFDPEQYRVHESAAGLATPFEYEYDDEDEDDLVALRRAYIWSPYSTRIREPRLQYRHAANRNAAPVARLTTLPATQKLLFRQRLAASPSWCLFKKDRIPRNENPRDSTIRLMPAARFCM
jgi:hypothetical protein